MRPPSSRNLNRPPISNPRQPAKLPHRRRLQLDRPRAQSVYCPYFRSRHGHGSLANHCHGQQPDDEPRPPHNPIPGHQAPVRFHTEETFEREFGFRFAPILLAGQAEFSHPAFEPTASVVGRRRSWSPSSDTGVRSSEFAAGVIQGVRFLLSFDIGMALDLENDRRTFFRSSYRLLRSDRIGEGPSLGELHRSLAA